MEVDEATINRCIEMVDRPEFEDFNRSVFRVLLLNEQGDSDAALEQARTLWPINRSASRSLKSILKDARKIAAELAANPVLVSAEDRNRSRCFAAGYLVGWAGKQGYKVPPHDSRAMN